MRPALWLAALALGRSAALRGPPAQTTQPAATDAVEELRDARKRITQDELTQQRLLKQKHTADVSQRQAEDEAARLRVELQDTRVKLDSANAKVASLTKEVAKEQTLAGDLAAKDGVAEVDAADEEADDRSETRAAKSMAVLIRRATTTQTSLLAQDQRLQVEALEGMRAKMAASNWKEQANSAASALEGSLGSATDLQEALDQVLERERRAEEARRKEKAFLTSRLKSEMEKLKASQDEVRALKAQRDAAKRGVTAAKNGSPARVSTERSTEPATELRADLKAAQKQQAALKARLDTADKKVRTLEDDNEKAAGTIRNLKEELHAERNQRKTAVTAPKKVQHVEQMSAPHKRHVRTKEQKEEEEDIY